MVTKSRNHKNFVPIGLLKLSSYYKKNGHDVKLVIGNDKADFVPDEIKITSLFTYWSKYVIDCARFYRGTYPKSKITVGGIYATLMPEHCKKETECDDVYHGVFEEAEKLEPDYEIYEKLIGSKLDFQIIHASRGCIRSCDFCGIKILEPETVFEHSLKDKIKKNRLVFYDNNLLANPYIEQILEEISNLKINGRAVRCESQCGFDGRLLTPEKAKLLKKARFEYPKIAWDGPFDQHQEIKEQLDFLIQAGYKAKDIAVFMLYNWDLPFEEMERKRLKCWEWKVQVADCRFRPLDQTFDNYNPIKRQTNDDYHIHKNWTDEEVKQFRKNVRRHNIAARHGFKYYSASLERKENNHLSSNDKKTPEDSWNPSIITYPSLKGSQPLLLDFIRTTM